MINKTNIAFLTFLILLIIKPIAQPDFVDRQIIHGVMVYPDLIKPAQFYYAPGKLKILNNAEGEPEFSFVQMRYTGTKAMGDKGERRFNTILKCKVGFERISADTISQIKEQLILQNGEKTELKPLNLHKIDAAMIYAKVHAEEGEPRVQVLSGGFFENNSNSHRGEIWKEKTFSIRLDKHSSQLFKEAFEKKQSAVSLGYAYYAYGVNSTPGIIDEHFEGEMAETIKQNFPLVKDTTIRDTTIASRLIYADAFRLNVDPASHPDLFKQVDINTSIPPGYAVLNVYCYDFNNELREDLYAKKVEIKAQGVNGREVKVNITFRHSTPDEYAHSVRFPLAVRLDQPFYYREIEIGKEGEVNPGEWTRKIQWYEILDVTSRDDND